MSSRVAPTHYLEPGRLDQAPRACVPAVSPDVAVALGVSRCSPSRLGGVRAARRRSCRAPAPDLGVRRRRLARLGQLLVRGPLRARSTTARSTTRSRRSSATSRWRSSPSSRAPALFASAVLRQWGRPGAPVGAAVRRVLARRARCRAVPVRARLRVRARGTRRAAARSPRAARPLLSRVAAREPARLPAARRHARRADAAQSRRSSCCAARA